MADEIKIGVVGVAEVEDLLTQLPNRTFDATKQAISTSVFNVHRKVSDRVRDGRIVEGTESLHARTGALRRSLTPRVSGTTFKTLDGRVFTTSLYAPTHEFGATIKAKNKYLRVPGGPYLNIPLPKNKTAAGVTRKTARQVFQGGGYIAKGPRRYVVMGSDHTPMFVLVKSVKIKPRLGMRKAADDEVPTLLNNLSQLMEQIN